MRPANWLIRRLRASRVRLESAWQRTHGKHGKLEKGRLKKMKGTHERGNEAQEQQHKQQEDTDPGHATPKANFAPTASHARHVGHGTRFPSLTATFAQSPIKHQKHVR